MNWYDTWIGYQIWKQCHIHFWKWDKTVKSLMIILGKIFLFKIYVLYPASTPASLPSQFEFEVSEVFSLHSDNQLEITEESIRDIQVVVSDQPCR